jgi:hypothetical protein
MKLGQEYSEAVRKLSFDDLKNAIINFKVEAYKEKCNDYSNVFYLMNLRENTQSELLAYLFDKNDFRKDFIKDFCKCISNNEIQDIELPKVNTQNTLEDNSRPDIIIKTDDFCIIIEAKLDAEINIKDGTTQLENYWKSFDNKKKNYLVFIYVNEQILKRHGKENDCKIGEISYRIDDYEKLKKLQGLLKEQQDKKFICIEFSDIVLILYKIFKLEEYNLELTHKNRITCNLINKLSSYLENNSVNKKLNIEKIENIKDFINDNNNQITKEILESSKYRRPKYCNISDLKTKLSNNNEWNKNDIKNLLIQFVYYWQYISIINGSYSKIITINKEYFYIWDICEEIQGKRDKDNNELNEHNSIRKKEYEKLEQNIKDKIKEIEKIKVYNATTK